VPRTVTVSTDLAAVSDIYVKFRPAGGPACASNAHADSGTEISSLYDTTVPFAGPFSFDIGWIFPAPGIQMLCIWIGPATNPSDTTVVTPIVQMVTLRPATGTISASEAPATEPATLATTVTVSGSSDFPVVVRATYRPAGRSPCASTYAATRHAFVDAPMITSGHFSFVRDDPVHGRDMDRLLVARDQRESGPANFARNAPFIGPRRARSWLSAPAAPRSRRPDPTCDRHHSVRGEDRDEHSLELPAHVAPLAPIGVVPLTSSKQPTGTCWLEVLDAGSWKAPGAHAKLNAKGTCRISARFASPGRKRLRIEFRPAASFARSDSPASWVDVTARCSIPHCTAGSAPLPAPSQILSQSALPGLASSTSHASTGVEPG